METTNSNKPERILSKNFINKVFLYLFIGWTALIIVLLLFTYNMHYESVFHIAEKECRTNFNKDVQYRLWATNHGGVYVPETEQTPPNPYLSHVPERDIVTPSGKKLTLMNPAYMTRQVLELGEERFYFKGSITSLNPINKENTPDEWEEKTLKAFEKGGKEKIEIVSFKGEDHIRFMARFNVEEGCLKCHEAQGYKIGDIKGGISISLPWEPFKNIFWNDIKHDIISYTSIWVLGLVGLFISYRKANIKNNEKEVLVNELEKSYDLLNKLSEQLPGALYQFQYLPGEKSFFPYASKNFEIVFEVTPEEVKDDSSKLFSRIHPEDLDCVNESIMNSYNDLKLWEGDFRVNLPKAGTRWLRGKASPQKMSDESVLWYGYVHDITERKINELEVERLKERYEFAIRGTDEGIWDWDITTNRVFLSKRWKEMLGYKEHELLNEYKTFISLLHEEDIEQINTHLTKYLNGEVKKYSIEFRMKHKDGSFRWIHAKGEVVRTQDGKPYRMAGSHADITDRKATENALQISEERNRLLSELTLEGIVIHRNGVVKDFNYSITKLFGYEREELLNRNFMDLVHADDKPIVQENITKDYAPRYEIRMIRKNGEIFYAEIEAKNFYSKEEKWRVSAIRDVTERKKAIDAIKQSERILTTLLNGIHETVLLLDTNYIVLASNDIAQERITQVKEELIGKCILDYFPNDVAINARMFLNRVIETKNPVQFEDERFGRIIDNYLTPILDEKGNVTKIVLVGINITERKQAEKELKEKNILIETILENAPIGFTVNRIDDSQALFMNSKFYEIYGVTPGEITSVDDFFEKAYLDPDFRKEIKERIISDITSGDPARMRWDDIPITTKTGEKKYVTAINIPVFEQNLMVSTVQDTTKRKLAELELIKSEEKFKKIGNSALDAIIMINDEGIVEYWNPAAEKIFGFSQEEIIGKKMHDFIMPYNLQELQRNAWNLFTETGDGKHVGKVIQITAVNKDKIDFPIELSLAPVKFGDKFWALGYVRDISERKRAEDELEKHRNHLEELVKVRTKEIDSINHDLIKQIEKRKEAERRLELMLEKEKELNQLKSKFISTASHEFRTPLTAVLSSAEMIHRYRSKWEPTKIDDHLLIIKDSVNYLTKLMDDVLTVNRNESGNSIYNPIPINLLDLCNRIIIESESIINEPLNFNFNYNANKKEFILDPKHIELIIKNLLSNAFKYTNKNGKVDFTVNSDDKEIIVTVKDQGIGIPDDDIPKIFNTFYRAKNTGCIQGTGLGLAIVKNSVELHGGKINVKSKIGEGTVFTVKVPLNK